MTKGKYRLASKVFYIFASTTHHILNSNNTFVRLVWELTADILGLRNVPLRYSFYGGWRNI